MIKSVFNVHCLSSLWDTQRKNDTRDSPNAKRQTPKPYSYDRFYIFWSFANLNGKSEDNLSEGTITHKCFEVLQLFLIAFNQFKKLFLLHCRKLKQWFMFDNIHIVVILYWVYSIAPEKKFSIYPFAPAFFLPVWERKVELSPEWLIASFRCNSWNIWCFCVCVCLGERAFFIIKFSLLEQVNWPGVRCKVRWCTIIIFLWSIWGEFFFFTNTLCWKKKKCHSSIRTNVYGILVYRPEKNFGRGETFMLNCLFPIETIESAYKTAVESLSTDLRKSLQCYQTYSHIIW